MKNQETLDLVTCPAKHRNAGWVNLAGGLAICAGTIASAPAKAQAVDGCKVLLCLAAPNWRQVQECVPTIHQLHRRLARGRPFPSCAMAGAGNSANNTWANAPTYCPPQYTRAYVVESAPIYACDYSGNVTVTVNGTPFTHTWWSMEGDTVTEFTPAAKAQLGTWDTKFDDDYALWLASLPPPAPPCDSC